MLRAVETRTPPQPAHSTSRIAEAFPLISAAVLALAGALLFVAVLWPETQAPTVRKEPATAQPTIPAPAVPEAPKGPAPAAEVVASPAPPAPDTAAPAPQAPDPAGPAPSSPSPQVPPDAAANAAAAVPPEAPAPSKPANPQTSKSATPPTTSVQALVDAAIEEDDVQVQQLTRDLASKRRVRGDRPRARQFNAQGLALMSTARYAEAVPAFEAALKADAGDPEIRENLGYALLKAERIDEAEQALLAALEIGPRRASAWGSLGFVYAKQGRAREAVQLILTAYRLAPNHRKALDSYRRQANTDSDPKVRAMLTEALSRLRQARQPGAG